MYGGTQIGAGEVQIPRSSLGMVPLLVCWVALSMTAFTVGREGSLQHLQKSRGTTRLTVMNVARRRSETKDDVPRKLHAPVTLSCVQDLSSLNALAVEAQSYCQ